METFDPAEEAAPVSGPRLADAELIAALQWTADEHEQTLLVCAFGASDGEEGPPFLRQLLEDPPPEWPGEVAAVAITPFAERCPEQVTPFLLEQFTSNNRRIDAQRWLLPLIAAYADDTAADVIIDWLRRRLCGKNRARYGFDDDVRLPIVYLALRPGCAPQLQEAGRLLMRMWPQLVKGERRWLTQHWRELAAAVDAGAGGDASAVTEVPRPSEASLARMRKFLTSDSLFASRVLPEHVRPILDRVRGPATH